METDLHSFPHPCGFYPVRVPPSSHPYNDGQNEGLSGQSRNNNDGMNNNDDNNANNNMGSTRFRSSNAADRAINMDQVEETDEEFQKSLVFSPYYYVLRHSRALKRSEVLGYGCISLAVITIALLAQLGLEALGYMQQLSFPAGGHVVHSFGWKLLSEFFISDSFSNLDKDCLFFDKKRLIFRKNEDPIRYMERVQHEVNRLSIDRALDDSILGNRTSTDGLLPHLTKCDHIRIADGWTWLCKYMSSVFLSILSVFCALVFLSCIRCRRRKGLQFTLLVPAFICFFLGIFQLIPQAFHYNYAHLIMMEDMQTALAMTIPPSLISPIWEETQIHGQCCGAQSSEIWVNHGFNNYPRSCCNTSAFPCPRDEFPSRDQIWSVGCFDPEIKRLRYYEGYALILLVLKLFAEIGIFWSMSDLTRYDYPAPEHQKTSSCNVSDFDVHTKGNAVVLGVTERQIMVVKLKNFMPGRFRTCFSRSGTTQTLTIRTNDSLVGSVEIRRQRFFRNRNAETPAIDLQRGNNCGLIFIIF